MNEKEVVFVYENKNTAEIRVEFIDNAKILEDDEFWRHIATLNTRTYIKSLLREYPSLIRVLKENKGI